MGGGIGGVTGGTKKRIEMGAGGGAIGGGLVGVSWGLSAGKK